MGSYESNYHTITTTKAPRKIYNLFVRAVETGRKASYWRGFLPCSAGRVNHLLYLTTIYEYCAYPVMPITLPKNDELTAKSRN
jgi:hypothetical protein